MGRTLLKTVVIYIGVHNWKKKDFLKNLKRRDSERRANGLEVPVERGVRHQEPKQLSEGDVGKE